MEDSAAGVLLDFTDSFKSSSKRPPERLRKPRQRQQQEREVESEREEYGQEDDEKAPVSKEERVEDSLLGELVEDDGLMQYLDKPNQLHSLTATLDQMGYASLNIEDEGSVVNVIQSLLKDLKMANDSIRSYESSAHKAAVDCKRLQADKDALQLQVTCLKQDNLTLENRVSVLVAQNKKDKQRADSWIKQLQVNVAKLEGQHKGWQASLNRKESEHERLQKRMQMLQSQLDRSIKRTMDMTAPPPPRGWRDAESEESEEGNVQSLEALVESSNARKIRFLLSENERLRASLASLQSVILTKLSANLKRTAPQTSECGLDTLQLSSASFGLPAHVLAEKMQEWSNKVQQFLQQLAVSLGEADDPTAEPAELTADELRRQLEEAKEIIMEQDNLLQMQLLDSKASSHEHDRDEDDIELRFRDLEQARRLDEKLRKTPHTPTQPINKHEEEPMTPGSLLSNLPVPATPATRKLLDEIFQQ